MYKILKAETLAAKIHLMVVHAPRVASHCQPGQFIIVKLDEKGERIPLTICDYDREEGTVTIVFQEIGVSTIKMAELKAGDAFRDFVGPLGCPSEFVEEDIEELKKKKMVFVAGGVGTAPVYPQVKWLHEHGITADVILGAKTKDMVILEKELGEVSNLYVTTDDGSYGRAGMVTKTLEDLVTNEGKHYDVCVAIGPMIMMKFVCLLTKKLGIHTIVSMNPIMVDGTGMCGACRLQVGDEIKFACVDGPEFNGDDVNFDEAMRRQNMYKTEEGRNILKIEDGETHENPACPNHEPTFEPKKRVPVREQKPEIRNKNFDEVCYGYNLVEAQAEAARCLNCKNPLCTKGCPVSIDIPGFIQKIKEGDILEAAKIIIKYSNLPAVCGRVCPQETQCEGKCILGVKGEPIAIGKLERFVGDWSRENGVSFGVEEESNGIKVAVVGSGPSGLACAGDLAKKGYDVTIFEAFHEAGGVLTYGIPEFRLPKQKVVQSEINNIKKLGV